MINIIVYRNQNSDIYGFRAESHGDPIVCSAVSALTMNAVNSIESFTDEHIIYEYDEKGGFLELELPDIKNGARSDSVMLLLNSMMLGLKEIEDQYPEHIRILDREA